MKIRMNLTIEVDTEAWVRDYGTYPGQIRDDVKSYVVGNILESAAGEAGAITAVNLKS